MQNLTNQRLERFNSIELLNHNSVVLYVCCMVTIQLN
jgi:hypothetical protein